jgi:hypothetical protein
MMRADRVDGRRGHRRFLVAGPLSAAIAEARSNGWAYCNMTLDEVHDAAKGQALECVPTRRGADPIGLLKPVGCAGAHRFSLSARYGLGGLPLHTDGAHLRNSPDLVLLEADACASTEPTLLYRLELGTMSARTRDRFAHGVFTVGSGRSSFYAHAMNVAGDIRFDPGCMRPIDASARYVVGFIEGALASAKEHHWAQQPRVLVIDNRRTLHGRRAVHPGTGRTLRRLMLRGLAL